MNQFFLPFIVSLLSILVLDAAWIGTMASRFYQRLVGHLLAESPNFFAAGIFYVLYAAGVTLFIVMPALQGNWSFVKVALMGAVLGALAYGTYDLTNQATLKNWPTIVSAVDIAWGMALTATISVVGVLAARYFS